MRLSWPLTGRSEELRLIDAAISDPGTSGVIIGGAPGVGKSRVAREALDHALTAGHITRWVIGTSSAREIPLGAFNPWVNPEIADPVTSVHNVIDALTDDPRRTTVVGIDDAHLLDDMSTFVVQQLIHRGTAKVILTLRDGEPIPAATHELWKDAQFDRLSVQPLAREEIAVLVEQVLGGPLDVEAAVHLWNITRGNVLYLRNIVDHDVRTGRLVKRRGHFGWMGNPDVPPGLVELIESRIGALPGATSDVVDVLAVGEPLELTALIRITDPVSVEEADVRGLITLESQAGRIDVRLAHPMYGEVRRRRAAPMRLRRLRGLLATELADCDDSADIRNVVRRAALTLDSDLQPDAALMVRAAKGAIALADHQLADRLADAAIRVHAGVDAQLLRAHALTWLDRSAEADQVFADIDPTEFDPADRAALVCARAANRLFGLADPDGAKKLVDDAVRTFTPPQLDSAIDAFHVMYWAALGDPGAAIAASTYVALDQLPDIVGALPAWTLTIALGDVGKTDEAVSAARTGYTVVARSLDAAGTRAGVADGHVRALLQAGRIAEACVVADELREQASDLPTIARVLNLAVAGRAALGAGRVQEASSLLEPVIGLLTTTGHTFGFDNHFQSQRTIALAMRGLANQAAAALATLEERRHPSWRCLAYERTLARAWVAACHGSVSEAITHASSAAEAARLYGQFAGEVLCLQTATQFGDRACATRLLQLEEVVEGTRVVLAARFAAGLRDDDAAELSAISDEFEQMGDLVAAVDAAAHAAIRFRNEGRRGSALSCSTRADALSAKGGGISTPTLRKASEPLPFTDREVEIVMLLGEGLPSRAIAEQLSLSVRTVEGHIYRAMAKADIKSRDDLAALLRRRKPTL